MSRRLAEIRGDDHRRQPLAEARRHVERAQRAVPQQVDALQRALQLGEERVDLRADARAALLHELRDRGAVPPRDRVERLAVRAVAALGQPRALEQLIRDALKRRYDDDDRLAPARLEENAADAADRRGRREGGSAELENVHR